MQYSNFAGMDIFKGKVWFSARQGQDVMHDVFAEKITNEVDAYHYLVDFWQELAELADGYVTVFCTIFRRKAGRICRWQVMYDGRRYWIVQEMVGR